MTGADGANWQEPDAETLARIQRVLRGIARFHRYRTHNLPAIPDQGACLVVVNHSLATYDISLLGLRIYEHNGRFLRGLGDRAIFKTPVISQFAEQIGVVSASPNRALELLQKGHLVMVAPGGMREALRPTRERYQLLWQKRTGFAKLAIAAQCPIILAACPRADDIFEVRESRFTRTAYKYLRLPLPVATGIGPTLIPKPVPLQHYLSDPITPPKQTASEREIEEFHRSLRQKMERLMEKGLANRQI